MKVNREVKKFILLNLIILFITQPGSLALASWDAPYGFMRDLTTWISSFVGLSPITLIYLILKRDSIGKKAIPAYIAFILILAYVTYSLQIPLFERFAAPGYKPSFLIFLYGCVLSSVISILVLLNILKNIGTGAAKLDPGDFLSHYNILLGAVNLVILLLIILLLRELREN